MIDLNVMSAVCQFHRLNNVEDIMKVVANVEAGIEEFSILLYDRDGFLSESRRRLVEELREKGVVKTDRWWSFPVKAGEEYTY